MAFVSQSNVLSVAGSRVVPAASPVTTSSISVDPQTAEMHSAAEKARLRRLAEEAERSATADRARRKAKELEERLGLSPATEAKFNEVSPDAPPGLTSQSQRSAVKLAIRLKQTAIIPQPTTSPLLAVPATAGLPPRPAGDAKVGESSWRTRMEGEDSALRDAATSRPLETAQTYALMSSDRPARATAESFFESSPTKQLSPDAMQTQHPLRQIPSHVALLSSQTLNTETTEPAATVPTDAEQLLLPKKEPNFDNMLARIQAAMAQARAAPPPYSPSREPVLTEEIRGLPRSKFEGLSDATAGAKDIKGPPIAAQSGAQRPADMSHPVSDAPREYFEVTQPSLPRSPPPAWRTYAVKLPRLNQPPSLISKSRLEAFEASLMPPPDGWLMSFEPPVDQLSQFTLSLGDSQNSLT